MNDEANYPWLKLEKRRIRRYLAAGKPAIGLCLGGQLIASALGAAVSHSAYHEVGGPQYSACIIFGNVFSIT